MRSSTFRDRNIQHKQSARRKTSDPSSPRTKDHSPEPTMCRPDQRGGSQSTTRTQFEVG